MLNSVAESMYLPISNQTGTKTSAPMSHQLRVWSQPPANTTDTPIDILWFCNQQSGVCRVQIDATLGMSSDDARIVAELSTVQWMLEKKQLFGAIEAHDIARTIMTFSCGAPAKLIAGRSTKTHLSPYAYHLRLRYGAATIETDATHPPCHLNALRNLSHLIVRGPSGAWLHMPGLGPVWLTHHLMRQFRMRLNNQPYQKAWQEMERILTTCRLQPLNVSAQTRDRDIARYRHPGVRLLEPKSRWVFVMLPFEDRPTLVTAYIHTGPIPPLLGNGFDELHHSNAQAFGTSMESRA